jgi:hypothetical protein
MKHYPLLKISLPPVEEKGTEKKFPSKAISRIRQMVPRKMDERRNILFRIRF